MTSIRLQRERNQSISAPRTLPRPSTLFSDRSATCAACQARVSCLPARNMKMSHRSQCLLPSPSPPPPTRNRDVGPIVSQYCLSIQARGHTWRGAVRGVSSRHVAGLAGSPPQAGALRGASEQPRAAVARAVPGPARRLLAPACTAATGAGAAGLCLAVARVSEVTPNEAPNEADSIGGDSEPDRRSLCLGPGRPGPRDDINTMSPARLV